MWWKSLIVIIVCFLLWRFVGWEEIQAISKVEVSWKVVSAVAISALVLFVLFILVALVVKPWKGTNSGSPRTQTQTPPVTPAPGANPGTPTPAPAPGATPATPPPQAGTAAPAASGPSLGKRIRGGLWSLTKGIWWLVSRLFMFALATILVYNLVFRKSEQADKITRLELELALAQSEEGAGSTKYVADIDAIPGHSIGNNYDGPLEAEIVNWRRGKVLNFNVHWKRHGVDEVMAVRLTWNGKGYQGYYTQDNPPDHGRVFLKEEGSTEEFSGTLEDARGTLCHYKLTKKGR